MEKIFLSAAFGDSALCGVRPEALPLDSAAFEKAGETFIMRFTKILIRTYLIQRRTPDGRTGL